MSYVKIFFHYKYSVLVREHFSNVDKYSKKKSLLNFYYLFELIAPVFIPNKEVENGNEEIAKIGRRVRILLFMFYFCFIYFLIAINYFESS